MKFICNKANTRHCKEVMQQSRLKVCHSKPHNQKYKFGIAMCFDGICRNKKTGKTIKVCCKKIKEQ